MTFYKIIQDENVVNVGCVFLKWNKDKNKLYLCGPNDAEFVQAIDESRIYKASWLNPAPKEAGEYELAKVIVIDETEFNDLRQLLDEGETVEEDKPSEPPVSSFVDYVEEQEEKPMTIAEMRQIIAHQQEQIEALIQKFQS